MKTVNMLNYRALHPHLKHLKNLQRNHHLKSHHGKLQRNLQRNHLKNHLKLKSSQLNPHQRVPNLPSHMLKKPPLLPKKLLLQPRKPLFQPKKLPQKPNPPLNKLLKQRKSQQNYKLKPRNLNPHLRSLKLNVKQKSPSLLNKQKPLKKQPKN